MKVYLSFFVCFLVLGCANIIPPSGGEKDSAPPITIYTNIGEQPLQFEGNEFLFEFDERIRVENLYSEFYLSPPINSPIEYSLKGSRLGVKISDTLKENTTYSLSLGSSISDLNEGNPMDPFDTCFSTGNFLDSLTLSGKINDALTNEPKKEVWALLYIYSVNMSDSLLLQQKADYITKTNKEGLFHFKSLKEGNYMLYALEDLDKNLKFSIPSESVGFYPQSISVPTDVKIQIKTFQEDFLEDSIIYLKRDSLENFGFLQVDSLPKGNMLVELLANDKVVFQKQNCSGSFFIDSLNVGAYKLRLIKDSNQNNKWDSGKIIDKRQAEEAFYYSEEIQIRDNWDLILNWQKLNE